MAPNHFLAVAVDYLFGHRPGWPAAAAVAKTLVSSSMIDRVAEGLGRRLIEVPVGSSGSWPACSTGPSAFAGEESAGASFLRRDGSYGRPDKDGDPVVPAASEIIAGDREHAE